MEQQDEQILAVEQMSEKNEWVADIAKIISKACSENQRGFVFIPFTHVSDMTDANSPKTCLLTDLGPMEFMAAIGGAIANYCRFRKSIYSKIGTGLTFMNGSEMAKHVLDGIKDMEEKDGK